MCILQYCSARGVKADRSEGYGERCAAVLSIRADSVSELEQPRSALASIAISGRLLAYFGRESSVQMGYKWETLDNLNLIILTVDSP